MAQKAKRQPTTVDRRTGGVYISDNARVKVNGDLVGRDKISTGIDAKEFDALFARLLDAIQQSQDLSPQEKKEAAAKNEELKQELKKTEPDLGKLDRLKKFFAAKGGAIAAAIGAVFQYAPVQEMIKSVAQRLVGG